MFVANLPWAAKEGRVRTCDRSLAESIPCLTNARRSNRSALDMLAACPQEMGLSYPANAVWRYWALAKGRRMQVVLDDFGARWTMASITENNTLAEDWEPQHDSTSQWSHCESLRSSFSTTGYWG